MDEDNEVGLPQKGLNMIMKDAIPEMRIANESREIFNNCCVEFIKYISREAQQISGNDQRKTIYHEHVQKALQNLKFPMDYIEAADSVLDECKEAAEKRLKRKNSRLDKCGIPEDQLYELQQQLIQKAREEQEAAAAALARGQTAAGSSQAGDNKPNVAGIVAFNPTANEDDYDT